jgi:hypothetical protein
VSVVHPPEDDNEDDRWYNENISDNSHPNRPGDILTISDGRSNVLTQLSQRVLLFTILFGVFSAWFLWRRIANGEGKERKRATVPMDNHGPENPVVEETDLAGDHLMINGKSITQIALLDNGTAIHPMPIIMDGHADLINDITSTPIPIVPTPSTSISLPTNSNPNSTSTDLTSARSYSFPSTSTFRSRSSRRQ